MNRVAMGVLIVGCWLGGVGAAQAQTDVIYSTGVSQMPGNSSWQNIVRALGDAGCGGACACDNTDSSHDSDVMTRRYLQVDNFAPYVIPNLHRITGVKFNVLARYAATSLLSTSRLRMYVQTSTPSACTTTSAAHQS